MTAFSWLSEHSQFDEDACLPYPFSRRADGYGRIIVNGKHTTAPRIMCELAHGAPPSQLHQAAHSCRGAKNGCVNPKHLRWATQSENELDKRCHKTSPSGVYNPASKLNWEKAAEARRMRASGMTHQAIADHFGVSRETMSSLLWNETWREDRRDDRR